MSFFGRLFGTEKAINDITDKQDGLLVRAGGWVNDLSYTDAEKAKNALEVRKWGLNQLEALAPFKIVQRVLAFAIAFIWSFVALNVIISIWFGSEPTQQKFIEFAFSDFIFWPVTVCFGLYFGGGFLESMRKRN